MSGNSLMPTGRSASNPWKKALAPYLISDVGCPMIGNCTATANSAFVSASSRTRSTHASKVARPPTGHPADISGRSSVCLNFSEISHSPSVRNEWVKLRPTSERSISFTIDLRLGFQALKRGVHVHSNLFAPKWAIVVTTKSIKRGRPTTRPRSNGVVGIASK
jgi:hypothetical protein